MSVELHRARFVEWTPSSVVSLAATPDGAAVAVGREDGSVELYDVAQDWRCVARAPGGESASLTALAWTAAAGGQLQLVSSSLNGQLVTWDFQALRPLSATDSNGGPVWHISAQPLRDRGADDQQQLAVACDDGSLRLFGVSDSGLTFRKGCTRVSARLLSTTWHPDGSTVVAGSSDGCLRCWDSRTGAELLRLTLARGFDSGMPACVWSVLVLPDGTLVSGDSEGRTCLWDGSHGTLLHSAAAHDADVLALACNPAGDVVFSAGVDGKVVCLGSTQSDGVTVAAHVVPPWTVLGHKRAHTHDVRALVTAPFPHGRAESTGGESVVSGGEGYNSYMLLSAGTDAQVIAYAADNFMKEHPVRVVRVPPAPCLSVAAGFNDQALLLCTYATWLDLWRLGASTSSLANGQHGGTASMELAAAPAHLARIHVRSKRHLLCSALSADGRLAAASDAFAPHLFAVALPPTAPRVRVSKRELPHSLPPATCMAFTPNNELLILASPSGALHLFSLGTTSAHIRVLRHHLSGRHDLKPVPDGRFMVKLAPASHVRVSPDSRWLVVAVTASHSGPFYGASAQSSCVCVYSLQTQRVHASLPLPSDGDVAPPVAAVTFTPDSKSLLVATSADVHLVNLSGVSGADVAWADAGLGAASLSSRLGQMSGPVQGLSLDPRAGMSAALIYSTFAICHVDFTRPLTQPTAQLGAKRRRVNGVAAQQPARGVNGRVITLELPCLLAAYFKPGAALLVERPWEEIMRALPAPLRRKRFGK